MPGYPTSAATTIPPEAGEAAALWWGHRALVFRKRRRVADSLPAHSKSLQSEGFQGPFEIGGPRGGHAALL